MSDTTVIIDTALTVYNVTIEDPTPPIVSISDPTTPMSIIIQSVGLQGPPGPAGVSATPDATLLARANHTGTQLASTISNFASTVLSAVLTGFAAAAGTVTSSDTILQAFQKLAGNQALKQNQLIHSQIKSIGQNGHGSTNTTVALFGTVTVTGTGLTHSSSAASGSSITCAEDGLYDISLMCVPTVAAIIGFTLNSALLTTQIQAITDAQGKLDQSFMSINRGNCIRSVVKLVAGDVIRVQTDATASFPNSESYKFKITKVASF